MADSRSTSPRTEAEGEVDANIETTNVTHSSVSATNTDLFKAKTEVQTLVRRFNEMKLKSDALRLELRQVSLRTIELAQELELPEHI